ncbi:hypothetical protein [Roseiconus lacunae]|uniref:hypothetical protein n=1 Tax=Roseiconus lacunae TaxID=2605694 RepID=UPI001E52FA1E|nr:hypothetical protein [Roseiconus lacunae]MCD0458601.1 hypothetical protein [Roseiconus lacunae]
MRTLLASELFSFYPASELIPVELPEPNESITSYNERIGLHKSQFGDGVIAYLLNELADTGLEEGIQRLNVSIEDLVAVRDGMNAILNTSASSQSKSQNRQH